MSIPAHLAGQPMLCPCGQSDIPHRDFREFLRSNREALLAARTVVKGERFGGAVMERRPGGGLYVGPDRASGTEVDTGHAARATRAHAARSPTDATTEPSGALRRLWGLLGG